MFIKRKDLFMKDERRKAEQPEVLVGIDVGSTTTKIVVMQTGNSDYKVVFSNYERHHADPVSYTHLTLPTT